MIKVMNLNKLRIYLKHQFFLKKKKEKYPKCLGAWETQQRNKIKIKEIVVKIKEAGIQQLRIYLKIYFEEKELKRMKNYRSLW